MTAARRRLQGHGGPQPRRQRTCHVTVRITQPGTQPGYRHGDSDTAARPGRLRLSRPVTVTYWDSAMTRMISTLSFNPESRMISTLSFSVF